MEFRRHELGADRHTICASSPRCGPNDLRFCHSKGSALRRVRRNQLPGRHMALGWVDVTVDAGDTPASSSACYRSDVVSRSEWQGRSFWRVRRPILSAYHVAVERLRLAPVISAESSFCTVVGSRCNEYVHGRGCYVWRSREC